MWRGIFGTQVISRAYTLIHGDTIAVQDHPEALSDESFAPGVVVEQVYCVVDENVHYTALSKRVCYRENSVHASEFGARKHNKRDQTGTAGMDHLDTAYLKDAISPFLKPASFNSAMDTYCRRCASV